LFFSFAFCNLVIFIENNYQQDACSSAIESMLDCCEQNEDKGFPSCDGFKFNLNKRKQARERAAAASDKKKY
jgi:hypothetical protein